MKNIAVLASGRGSNFQGIIDGINCGKINGKLVCLITDKPDAYAITRAKSNNIPVIVIDFSLFKSREDYNRALNKAMLEAKADLFILAGYMRLLDDETAKTFSGKMINIHPALLPSFTGLKAQKQAIEYGVKVAGCTVHFVDEGMDTGPIILQHVVPVFDTDDEEKLSERILKEEHIALPKAVELFCNDKIKIEGRIVRILPE
ncbi:phosphoribosylglycinamide formyltransferase [Methanoplanus sp. FWC-SCC4]|uniref:phosphoribosylglycinamide formyltransferase 1 n=1 Tax=Methanochimaera problematica TaxID=2609417 RepID=A0AA97FCM2_9EURY|nr:phosphoribosylglycinamide formyltransferase [Methanoplanus sp. FWC-SCC4]WOF15769.1 phosphoribosylglycinamide formyltransferase [Methanoplanus sp. FWC-SCC4]